MSAAFTCGRRLTDFLAGVGRARDFSSSAAAFADRDQASAQYARVADGTVPLEGGWRIYSSGPGIALGIVITRLLGIRREGAVLVIDPVIPPSLDGLRARVSIERRDTMIDYRIGSRGHGPPQVLLDGQPLPFTRGANPYRTGGAEIAASTLHAARRDTQFDRLTVVVD